jgi:hypothetical protein
MDSRRLETFGVRRPRDHGLLRVRYDGWVLFQEPIRGGVPNRLNQETHGSESLRNEEQAAE